MRANFCHILVAWSVVGLGCDDAVETPRDHVDRVQTTLNSSEWETAETQAAQSLETIEATSAEGLQLQGQRLEAMARAGSGGEALALLEELAEAHPQQFGHEEYLAIVYWLARAGACDHLVDVISAGNLRYPQYEETLFLEAATKSNQLCGAGGMDETEMLESLGYL